MGRERKRSTKGKANCRANKRPKGLESTSQKCVTFNNGSDQNSCLLEVNTEASTLKGDKGYRTARATHSVKSGTWFYELEILKPPHANGHVRAGWTTSKADLEYPVGYAEDSYAIRDVDGSKVSRAYRQSYLQRGFGWNVRKQDAGDVLGVLIRLPEGVQHPWRYSRLSSELPSNCSIPTQKAATVSTGSVGAKLASGSTGKDAASAVVLSNSTCSSTKAARPPPGAISLSGAQAAMAHVQQAPSLPSSTPKTHIDAPSDAEICFFVNGKTCGPAFTDIRLKKYYPAVSLYMQAMVRWNFGPNFKFPPKQKFKAMCLAKK